MEIYAAMIANIDFQLGWLFGYLKKAGKWENTVVIFLSDNGANGLFMHQYPHTDEVWVARNSDNRLENPGRKFSRTATGPAWAQVNMTPYRMFKNFVAEGGTRTLLIVAGPGVEKSGAHSDAFTHVMDIAATILDVSEIEHPGTSYKGRKVEVMPGRSLTPVLSGKADFVYEDDTAVSWELYGMRAVRKGNFKLLRLVKPFGPEE